jgi:hypothetical protein
MKSVELSMEIPFRGFGSKGEGPPKGDLDITSQILTVIEKLLLMVMSVWGLAASLGHVPEQRNLWNGVS